MAKAAGPLPSRTAAVTITVPGGGAVSGGLVLEVPGDDAKKKADTLARQISAVLEGVQVARPSKSVELRLRGLDDSITQEEIAAAIATVGGCDTGDVRVGEILRPPRSMGIAWARCPVGVASGVLKEELRVGWSRPK
ncbi:uncharacterized protein LOC112466868, partial [Temnothorax curvispinosus]|uniref:Uncharacterized protein LOC112466868 n=1 Tax=Temnothorax curvispinosus TaxID=300111 RepID=A0A6J1RDM5_9HYME